MWVKLIFLHSLVILICGSLTFGGPSVTRTPLPTLTVTPVFYQWNTDEVMRMMQLTGLETETIHVMTPEEYGSIPVVAAQGLRFSIPSSCPHCEGIVFSFNTPTDLDIIKRFYTSSKNNPQASAWVFEKDNILLHLSGDLPEAQALQYGAVLIRLD